MTRTDTAWRIVNARPERVYQAFVDPVALAAWLPPNGMKGRFEEFDLRPGGAYRMVLTFLERDRLTQAKTSKDTDVAEGRFIEVIPNRRIVQEAKFESDDPRFAGTMVITWSFDDCPNGTRVTVRCDNVPDGISKADHDAGLKSSLENLAAFLK